MSAAVQSSQSTASSASSSQEQNANPPARSNTATNPAHNALRMAAKRDDRTTSTSSSPIQFAKSTGVTVMQHLAATREQNQRLKGSKLTRNDLINSKAVASSPSASASASNEKKPATNGGVGPATKAPAKATTTSTSSTTDASRPSAVTLNKPAASSAGIGAANAKKETAPEHDEGPADKKPARRRKANRACSHCQKAHLTCEDSRPCQRCIKKGLADSCTDGARKKAKYLLDDDELFELKREKERKAKGLIGDAADDQGSTSEPSSNAGTGLPHLGGNGVGNEAILNRLTATPQEASWDPGSANAASMRIGVLGNANVLVPSHLEALNGHPNASASMASQHTDADLYGHLSSTFSPSSSAASGVKNAFDSENASLEYSILSSMLNGIDPSWLSGSPDQQTGTDVGSVLNNGAFSHMGIDSMPWQMTNAPHQQQQQHPSITGSTWKDTLRTGIPHAVEPLHHLDATLAMGGGATPGNDIAAYDALEVPSPKPLGSAGISSSLEERRSTGSSVLTETTEQEAQKSKAAAAAAAAGLDHKPDAMWRERVKHIYGDQTRPFPYTEGYHFLIKYVTANLDKADVLRIVRALAIFRPSLIALQMPLTEDDEIFVERSIQRTILEFEKLISFSGTPTVVWRRTCEIVVVGAEFSMLTQWSKDYVMGRYIYEFFEKPSILDYWEKFALHAFENTAQSIMMPVTLKTSAGTTTRCAACFSIKRDIFDLPSLIVGNFLPILS